MSSFKDVILKMDADLIARGEVGFFDNYALCTVFVTHAVGGDVSVISTVAASLPPAARVELYQFIVDSLANSFGLTKQSGARVSAGWSTRVTPSKGGPGAVVE